MAETKQSKPFLQADHEFEALVQQHAAMVFRSLLRLTGSREHIEDLAQEVFLRLYRALPTFRGDALVSTYLYRIVVNVAHDERKRKQRQDAPLYSISDQEAGWDNRISHPARSAEQQLAEEEFAALVEDQLQQLSTAERTILVLYHQEERSYAQIAETLHMPVGTVRTHLHRGRRKLRALIEQAQAKELRR